MLGILRFYLNNTDREKEKEMAEYFENKVAVVTGAASGIGLGLTENLPATGASAVFMGDLNQENLAREIKRLNKDYPGKVYSVI